MTRRKFPLYIDLGGKPVTLVGGGAIAARRAKTLSQFDVDLTVIAPSIDDAIRALPGVTCVEQPWNPELLGEAVFVLTATDSEAVNASVVATCRERGIPVNDASNQNRCDFQFPAVAIRGDVVVGVNAGGTDHSLVRRIAAAIRTLLEGDL